MVRSGLMFTNFQDITVIVHRTGLALRFYFAEEAIKGDVASRTENQKPQ